MAYKFQLGTAKLSGSIEQTDGSAITANSSFVIGSADINETDLEKIDGITDGTAAANKAVVLDIGRNITNLGNVTSAGNIEAVQLSASTNIVIGNADINETDLEKLDGITDGTGAANKALVLDGSRDIENINNLMAANLSASAAIIIGNASMSEADLEQIDGITAGTVTASKAVVVDASKDISAFRNLEAVQLSASTNIVIGNADINETDLEKIDGITNGTVAANKAVVVDASSDISGFRNISGSGNLQVGNGIAVFGDIDKGFGGTLSIGNDTATAITLGASDCPVTIPGNLIVQGSTTTVESQTLSVKDSLIELNVVTGSEGRASNSGAGFFISGSTADKEASLTLTADGGRFKASGSAGGGFDIAAGGDYRINNSSVLNATTLGSAVVASSLTSVGALAGGSIANGFTAINVANVININSLDIDGATDIGANLADGDLVIVDDGAGGTNRKATMSRIATYVGNNISETVQTKNSDGALSASAGTIVIAQSASTAYGLRLEPASQNTGKIFKIKRLNGPNVTIECGSGDTIDGQNSVLLESEFAAIMVFSDGSNYHII